MLAVVHPQSDSHINHSFLGVAREWGSVAELALKRHTRPHKHVENPFCAYRQKQGDRLILLQKAMNKTFIDMHIKRRGLTKKNKAKQRCWANEKRRGECFLLNLLWIPNIAISKGLAQRPSGDAPLLHLDIIAPLEKVQVSAPRGACRRLVRHVLQFEGLQLSSY